MTDTGSSRPALDTSRVAYGTQPDPTRWTGFVIFAALMMLLIGTLQMIEGLTALLADDHYEVPARGLAVDLGYVAWGWIHLLLGAAIFASGLGVLAGNVAARVVGVALAATNAVASLLFLAAAPLWGAILVTVDVLVIYALTVHGRELRDAVT
jgi:hypothetical protein